MRRCAAILRCWSGAWQDGPGREGRRGPGSPARRAFRPGSGVLLAEAELLDAGAERGGADAQQGRGPVLAIDLAVAPLQGIGDIGPLQGLHLRLGKDDGVVVGRQDGPGRGRGGGRRQGLQVQETVRAACGRAQEAFLQFADIAGPGIGLQASRSVVGKGQFRPLQVGPVMFQKGLGQRQDVFRALTQGSDADGR